MKTSEFYELLEESFRANGLERFLQVEIEQKFFAFTERLMQANREQNLTAIRDVAGIISRHYADCLLGEELIPSGANLLDVGCGGGFPTFPLAIARGDLRITAIDSTQKKVSFVERTAKELGLSNVEAVCGRMEEDGCRKYRERFDVVTARAVANLRVLCELTIPFVAIGGSFVAMKGMQGEEELAEAQGAIEKLGGKVEKVLRRELVCMGENGKKTTETRILLVIRKVRPTPEKYPRPYAAIKKGFT